MQTQIKVTDITILDLTPTIRDPALRKYLPDVLFASSLSFQIHNVSNAVSNAIRRTLACELLVKAMHTEYADIVCDDEFIIPEMIIKRFKSIPIDQTIPDNTTFHIHAKNTTALVRDVKAGEIKTKGGKNPFNSTFTLFALNPGKSFTAQMSLRSYYGFSEGDGMCAMAVHAVSLAVDQEPFNPYTRTGIPSRQSNPRVWKVAFDTNGILPPKTMVVLACDNIISRVEAIRELMHSIESNRDEYILTVQGESDTIGNLFMRTISDEYKDIIAVSYTTTGRTLTIRIRCIEDINIIYRNTITQLVKTFSTIKSYFK